MHLVLEEVVVQLLELDLVEQVVQVAASNPVVSLFSFCSADIVATKI